MNYKNTAIYAAKKSGIILKEEFKKTLKVEKKNKHDIVSVADYRSEKEILKIIRKQFSQHSIIAEESGIDKRESDYIWYVDPLDGTSNFMTGNPYFSISIALAFKGNIILGVVYNPILNEVYCAELGKGSYLNKKRLHVIEKEYIKDALLASAYSSDENDIKKGLKTVEKLALRSRKVIINFSPALDLCNIARGKIDGLVDNGTTPEDHAAGSLIVKEAGGVIRNYYQNSFDVSKTGIIASGKNLFKSIVEIIN